MYYIRRWKDGQAFYYDGKLWLTDFTKAKRFNTFADAAHYLAGMSHALFLRTVNGVEIRRDR